MTHSPADAMVTPPAPHDERPVAENPIRALQRFGQSVWLDYLGRSLFTSGEFSRLITEDGLRGATSNPSIFEKAIAGSTDYLDALQEIERRQDATLVSMRLTKKLATSMEGLPAIRPTLEAFRDHGRLRASLGEDVAEARHVIAALESTGISLREVTDRLLEDGVTLFDKAFDALLATVARGRARD
jgi:transaldolase